MFGNRWQLFRLLGIPVSVDASWLIILALLTLTFAHLFPDLVNQFFQGYGTSIGPAGYWIIGLIVALAFFGCILLHEFGHAVVARAHGIPIRGITLFLFGGVAELVDEPASAGSEFVMAIAGPAVSVALAILFALLSALGYYSSWPPAVVVVLGYLGFINILVLIFNLVPAFPLDGGRVLRSIIWGATGNLRRATYWASLGGRGFAWILIAWGIAQLFQGNWLGGIWTGLIGLFLNRAAQSSYQQVLVRQVLQGEPVQRFMNPNAISVSPTVNLRSWVEDYVYRFHRKAFPVMTDGHLLGFVNTQALSKFPRSEWDQHTVGELMRHDLDAVSISPHADALQALGKMQRTGSSRLLVTDGDRLLGIVSLKDLLRFLNLKIELDGINGNGHRHRADGQGPKRHDQATPV